MMNPFPGMNPFIEANGRWPDFNLTFIATCRELLLSHLPSNFDVRIDERVQLLDQGDVSVVSFRPDVSVVSSTSESAGTGGVAVLVDLEPVVCHSVEPETESVGFIEIVTSADARLVTVIEVLSPAKRRIPVGWLTWRRWISCEKRTCML